MDADGEDKKLRTRTRGTKGELEDPIDDPVPITPWNVMISAHGPTCVVSESTPSLGLILIKTGHKLQALGGEVLLSACGKEKGEKDLASIRSFKIDCF